MWALAEAGDDAPGASNSFASRFGFAAAKMVMRAQGRTEADAEPKRRSRARPGRRSGTWGSVAELVAAR